MDSEILNGACSRDRIADTALPLCSDTFDRFDLISQYQELAGLLGITVRREAQLYCFHEPAFDRCFARMVLPDIDDPGFMADVRSIRRSGQAALPAELEAEH